jgi:glycosyltransferase involved in cell wall biosynthesis
MASLRICIVAGTYPPAHCGVGDYTELLAGAMAARGAEVSVITSAYLKTPPASGNPKVLPVAKEWSLKNAANVLRQIMATKPDIVHFQFPTAEYYPHRLFDLLVMLVKFWPSRKRVVVTLHEPVTVEKSAIPGLFRPLRHWLSLFWSDGIVVVSNSYLDSVRNVSARMSKMPCKVIPIASNIPISKLNRKQLNELREKTGVAPGTVLLSHFGFIQPRKGFEDALEVLTILRGDRVPAELLIIGELSASTPYHKELLDRISQDGLKDSVKVLGHVIDRDRVSDYLAMSDACILPFVDGVHPKRGSFLAAVRQGTLAITTSIEKKGLVPDENVFYARPGDAAEMARGAKEYAGRRASGQSSVSRSWEQVADEHLALFEELLR